MSKEKQLLHLVFGGELTDPRGVEFDEECLPGAVVSLMDRSNVETVLVAGRVRSWRGVLQEADLHHLR